MRRRLLIVVSSYRPAMLADMQRARLLAWELPALGWKVEILTPASDEVRQDAVEGDGGAFFPQATVVHEVVSSAKRWFERLGIGALSWRMLWPLYRRGCVLLRTGRYDLMLFSTSTFRFFLLGSLWRRKFGVPYVLDFHDPWVRGGDDSLHHNDWKAPVMRRLDKWMERSAVLNASGIVSVSPRYIDDLRARFGAENPAWMKGNRHAVIPIGASMRDLAEVQKSWQPRARGENGKLDIVYVGAGGPIMRRGFSLICRAIAALRAQNDPLAGRVRLRLYGTHSDWKPGDEKTLEQTARESGIGDSVAERPERVSYRHALELLLESDGALILGVDDPGYMPSKFFIYALLGKPLLAALRSDGPAYRQFRVNPALGHVLLFDTAGEMPLDQAAAIVRAFLADAATRRSVDREAALAPYLAPAMARRHADLFEACL